MEKIFILFLALVAGFTCASLHKRISGPNSRDCEAHEGRHQVMISMATLVNLPPEHKDFRDVFCGGTLIHANWVLTAAHCDDKDLVVLVGDRKDTADVLPIADKDKKTFADDEDIMLLKLPKQINNRQPAVLPDQKCTAPTPKELVHIFGPQDAYIDTTKKMYPYNAGILRCGVMTVLNDLVYKPKYGHTFCARGDHVDGNKGDSGSGLIWNDKLHGVQVSGFPRFCTGATRFMAVCSYRDWIFKTAGV